jgi:hypothetical protein
MRIKKILIRLSIMLLSLNCAQHCFGQAWSGLLTSSRAMTWSPTVNGDQAGPSPTGTPTSFFTGLPNCATQPSAQTAAALQAAMAADAGSASKCKIDIRSWATVTMSQSVVLNFGGVANVYLVGTPGTTDLVSNGSLNQGCGPSGAILLCFNGGGGGLGALSNTAAVTSGFASGSSSLTLASHANLFVGSLIEIAQSDPSSDTGNVWPCQTTGSSSGSPAGILNCSQQGATAVSFIGGVAYGVRQFVTVTGCGTSTQGAACTSNSITIDVPLQGPLWNSSLNPTALWSSTLPISNTGVYGVILDTQAATGAHSVYVCTYCVNNTITYSTTLDSPNSGDINHFLFWSSEHFTASFNYSYGSSAQAQGYAFDPTGNSSFGLIMSNITQHVAGGYVNEGAMGVVWVDNVFVDNYFGAGWMATDSTTSHSEGSAEELSEGNIGSSTTCDDIHGSSWFNTLYRDYYSGLDPAAVARNGGSVSSLSNRMAVEIFGYCRYYNVVGNVLGNTTTGAQTTYQYAMSSQTDCGPGTSSGFIYILGDANQNVTALLTNSCLTNGFNLYNDTSVVTNLMRWGNWDAIAQAVRENSGETASAASTYPGLASPATTFPSSLFFTSEPSWWNCYNTACPYPGIGPDVTGGNITGTGGHANLNPADACYLNQMGGLQNGSSGILSFNPVACYGSSTPTAAQPTGSPIPGTYATTQNVALASTTPSSTITYCVDTVNTCTPTTTYSAAISISSTSFIRAFTTASGFLQSPTSSLLYTISTPTLAPPTVSPTAATTPYYLSGGAPTITATASSGASIFYTLNGATPTCSSTLYSGPVAITASGQNFQAVACQSGFTTSAVAATGAFTQTSIILDAAANNAGTPGGVNPITCGPITPTATGEMNAVEVVWSSSATLVNVTDTVNSGVYSAAFNPAMHANVNNGIQGGIFFYPNPVRAATTINVNLTGNTAHFSASCQVFKTSSSGTFVLDTTATQQQDGTAANPTSGAAVTPANANSLILSDAFTCTQIPTAGSGYYPLASNPGPQLFTQYQVQTTATATNAPWVAAADTTGSSCNAGWTDQQAAFSVVGTTTYTFTTHTTGNGTVNCTPPAGTQPSGTVESCTASPATGSGFTGWSGTGSASACTGTGGCSFTLTANSTVTAAFTVNPPATITGGVIIP